MIDLNDFSFTYRGAETPSLKDISFSATRGEFIGIVGAEGSGRTTLFRILNGSAPGHFRGSYTGTAMVGGLNPCEAGHPAIGEFAASIFDNPDSQIVNLTVGDEVGFALVQHGHPMSSVQQRVSQALAYTGLSGMEQRTTGSLSGGQKQRLVTASALALDPKLVLTDESASALDPKGARDLYNLLSGFSREKGVTVVAIEKDLELLMDYADRIIVMKDGRIILDALPGDLAAQVELLESAGIRVPAWLMTISILSGKGILKQPFPESEAATVELLNSMMDRDGE